MLRHRRLVLLSAAILAAALVALLLPRLASFWREFSRAGYDFGNWAMGRDAEVMEKMDRVRVGMSEAQVAALLGEPYLVDRAPYVRQAHGRREEYGKKIPNPNKCYWYSTGADWTACVVFDEQNRVAYVNVGGT